MSESKKKRPHEEAEADDDDDGGYSSDSEEDAPEEDSADAEQDDHPQEKASEEEIYLLEQKIKDNPMAYDTHVQYIAALRTRGQSERLRKAREDIHSKFPLPEEVWKSWLEDEEKWAADAAAKQALIKLYEEAVKDYQSVPLWTMYGSFMEMLSVEDGISEKSMQAVRDVYESAVTDVGINIAEGFAIWNAYRNFESTYLDVLESAGDRTRATKQAERVRSLFRRQLSVPLRDIEQVHKEYVDWEKEHGGNSSEIKAEYENALKALKLREQYEDNVPAHMTPSQPDVSKLSAWFEYLDFEESQRDPIRIQKLYERAITGYALVAQMWSRYLTYLETALKGVPAVIMTTFERAVRHCTWSGALWAAYIRAAERSAQQPTQIDALYERAIYAGLATAEDVFDVIQAYGDALIRRGASSVEKLREIYHKGVEFLTAYGENPFVFKMQRVWAQVEANRFKSIEKARKVYEEALKHHGMEADMWLEYITLERYCGDTTHARSLLKRACNTVQDQPERLGEYWLQFERECGDLEQWELAFSRVRHKLLEVSGRREREAAQLMEIQRKSDEHKQRSKESRQSQKKRGDADNNDRRGPKRARNEGAFNPSQQREERTSSARRSANSKTIHISNLSFAVKEEELREMFGKFGSVSEVRLVRDKDGRSKGFAFVEFETEKSAQDSLALDKSDVKGRAIGVSLATAGVAFEPLTVFVSNLTPNVTEEQLREKFQTCGSIKAVRLIKNAQTQQSKGYAYIDFVEKQSMQAAIGLNGEQMDGKAITVRESLPPKQKAARPFSADNSPNTSAPANNNPAASEAPVSTRPTTSLIPRSVGQRQRPGLGFLPSQMKKKSDPNSANATSTSTANTPSPSASGDASTSAGGKSNDDFRKMLGMK